MKKQRGNPFIGCEQSKNATNQNKGTGVTEETFHILGGGGWFKRNRHNYNNNEIYGEQR